METRICGWSGCDCLIDKINPKTQRPFFYCELHIGLRKKHKRTFYMKNRENHNKDALNRYHKLRKAVVDLYGNKCNCCGEDEYMFLALDHVDGGGKSHRNQRGSYGVYKDAIESYDPNRFQILCHNCNMAKGLYGECPHKKLANLQEN